MTLMELGRILKGLNGGERGIWVKEEEGVRRGWGLGEGMGKGRGGRRKEGEQKKVAALLLAVLTGREEKLTSLTSYFRGCS